KKWNDSEAGIAIVNSDQDLFSVFRQNRFANSNTLRLHFKRDLNLGWNWQTVLLQQWGDKANLGILQTDLKRRDRFRQMHLGMAFGLGNSTTGIMGGGFALRADYEQELNEWEIRAENYFASKNYPGLFGGQMQLREQITYLGWQKWRVSGILNLNQFPVRNFFRPAFACTRLSHWNQLESQVTYLLPRRLQFSVTPVLLHQRVAQQSGINPSKIYNNYSPRTRFGVRKDLRYFSINANLDAGLSQTNTADERGPFCRSWRSNLSVNYRKTGLSMFYNEGPYYLFEEVEFAQLFGAEQFFSGNLYQKFSLFHGWIEGQLNGQVIYDRSRSRWNQNIRLGLSGMLFTGWQWRTEVSHLQSGTFNNTFFNLGVSKNWQTYRDFAANNRLTLQLFFDENQNGERDETEEAVSGLFVKIDEEFLLTDNRGIARLSGLEPQGYQLSVTDPTGKFAQYQTNIFIEKSEEIVIGLTPAFIVAGKINLIRERFSDTRIFASGIKITLMSVSGKEYHTYTNADGSYEITVPRGRYYVKIPNAFKDSRFKIADNFQKVAYDGKVDRQVINFAVTVRSRKTKIKYFGKN
ncbi:MAG: collagen binding domain-containing protein, partial [Saprospiraceae bacterium]